MTKDEKPQDLMGYEAMQQHALLGVVRSALVRAASKHGLPGEHHLYITFRTDAAGVLGPDEVLGRYEEEMTIVLQHQFWDLTPGEDEFAVTLQFGGHPKKLVVPYGAITRFYDPNVQYLLQFAPTAPKAPKVETIAPPPVVADGPKIVSLDQFRKK